MKRKILTVSAFSLCFLALFAAESQAFFGLLSPYHPSSLWHRNNRYVTQITCRPYNAFTPICWGNMVCDGCVPSPCGVASGCMPMQMGMPPWAHSGGCGMPFMGGGYPGPDQSYASDMPMMAGPPMHHQMQPMHPMPQGPQMPMPGPGAQPFTPPMPMPMAPGTTMAYPYNGVSQANYYPQVQQYPNYYMPNYYNPYQGWPTQQPMPYYWYGSGR